MQRIVIVLVVLVGCDGGSSPEGDGGSSGGSDAPLAETCPSITPTVVDVPSGFVTDGTDLYWVRDNELFRTPAAGGSATKLADVPNLTNRLEINATHVFLLADTDVYRVPLSGGGPELVGTLGTGTVYQTTVDASAFYAVQLESSMLSLQRVAPMQATATVASLGIADIEEMRSDGTHVYFAISPSGEVKRVPVTGGVPESFANSSVSGMAANIFNLGMAVVGDDLVWSANYQSFPDGRLFAQSRTSGERRELSNEGPITQISTLGSMVYAAVSEARTKLVSVPLTGGPRSIVGCVNNRTNDVTATSAGVFSTEGNDVVRFP